MLDLKVVAALRVRSEVVLASLIERAEVALEDDRLVGQLGSVASGENVSEEARSVVASGLRDLLPKRLSAEVDGFAAKQTHAVVAATHDTDSALGEVESEDSVAQEVITKSRTDRRATDGW